MNIAIAVLTWNRLPALEQIITGLSKHCGHHKIAIFEDAGLRDQTANMLRSGSRSTPCPNLLAERHPYRGIDAYVGLRNLGVAGNTNRAIRWFMRDSNCDYLCICNDDVVINGDFASLYANVYGYTGIGLFCFCGFTSQAYAWDPITFGSYTLKKLGRMTGAVLSMPRELIDRIGYFDLRFGKFGEEHCDFTNRANLAGFQNVAGQNHTCLDVVHDLLSHLEIDSTVSGNDRVRADAAANAGVSSVDYQMDGFYRPFMLEWPADAAGVDGRGISVSALRGCFDTVYKEAVH